MTTDNVVKILIRHVSGSKAGAIEDFVADSGKPLRLGRDPSCEIRFDATRDDVVSRVHAAIKVDPEMKSGFSVEDLGSRNGTFLNKKKLVAKTELLPEDVLTLGANGPNLIFDLSPRPSGLVARTKILDLAAVDATRAIDVQDAAAASTTMFDLKATTSTASAGAASGGKETIGRATMLHEIGKLREEEEGKRKQVNLNWMIGAVAATVVTLAGGGYLYWSQLKTRDAEQLALSQARQETARVQRESAAQQQEAVEGIRRQMGKSSLDIVREFGPALAKVDVKWRLYDQETGKAVYHKVVTRKNEKYRAFVRFANGLTVPWLTLDDENRTNLSIGDDISGTAFVVSDQGFLLTNQHLAAAWKTSYYNRNSSEQVLLFDCGGKGKDCVESIIELSDSRFDTAHAWSPDTGWFLFKAKDFGFVGGNTPDNTNTRQRSFYGKNEELTVTFSGNHLGMAGTLVRVSADNDVALLKVETPGKTAHVELAAQDEPASGEKITVLGFPAIAEKTLVISKKVIDDQVKKSEMQVLQPYVTEGIIALVSKPMAASANVSVFGHDMIQLTINSTGPGNSGGPVFNSLGQVIGIFTMSYKSAYASSSGAVPIKYGLELMR